LRTINTSKHERRNLRTKITSIITVVLIVVFAGVLQRTYKSGSAEMYTVEDNSGGYSETINVAAVYNGTISRNSSLYSELLNWPIPKNLISDLTGRFSRLFDLRSSKPGDSFKVFMGQGDTIVAFEYITSDWKRYRLDRDGSGYVATVNEIGLDRKVKKVDGVIKSSLWDALLPLLPDMEIFSDLTDIFGWEIDFLTEPRVGDKFTLIFETFEKDGVFVRPGKILAAEYSLSGAPHRAFLYQDSSGHIDYYDENGYSLKKTFLKSPLNYRRISSRFSMSRLHPIYKIYRPHLGVDYAAASGTPIVAAGDGHVIFKGWKGGFGNYIEIQHPSSMITCYGHLRGFAKGLANGERVNQGQIIGYVGSTGDATGPHLDYRVKKGGRFVDPLKMVVPASLPVKDEYKAEFKTMVAEYLDELKNGIPEPVLAQQN
jgi:murein DD-endopeptidase MepM/ murein hydrolase activator NlpD